MPGTWLYEPQSAIYYYSPERALQLLNEAGWTNLTGPAKLSRLGEDGLIEDLELRIVTYTDGLSSVRTNAAEQIAANLRALGIEVTVLSGSESQVTSAIEDGRFDLALVGVNLSEVPNLRPLLRRMAASTSPAPPAPNWRPCSTAPMPPPPRRR